jgi:hypothetical protein
MPALPLKVRTLEGYLAGLGASGALMAGAVVACILLVGIVTFNAWPTGSSVFNKGADDVSVDTSLTTSPPAREQPNVPNLVKLLGGGGAASSTSARAGGASGGSAPNEPSSGSGKSPSQRGPQQSNPGAGQQQPSQPTRNPQGTEPAQASSGTSQVESRNTVQQLVYGVGNTVEADTSSLSDTLGGQDTLLGGLTGGLGSTLNSTLQGLAGNR